MISLPVRLQQLLDEHCLDVQVIDSDELYGEYDPDTYTIALDRSLEGRALYLVILHEVAHYLTPVVWYTKPHGKEWQSNYRDLVDQFRDLFPKDILDMFKWFTLAKETQVIKALNV